MSLRLRMQFEDAKTFAEEFRKNISKGGAFFACADEPDLRTILEVELEFSFCGETRVLEAEVVYVMPGSGVAVQFLRPAEQLRDDFESFLGETGSIPSDESPDTDAPFDLGDAPPLPEAEDTQELVDTGFDEEIESLQGEGLGKILDELVEPELSAEAEMARDAHSADADPLADVDDRRRSARAAVRTPVRLDSTNVSLEGRTRNLSETGVLVSADGSELPLGKKVRLELQHPETGEPLEVSGTVTRHIEGEGTVAAVGVDFEPSSQQKEQLEAFVGEAKQVEAERAASGISGRIEELGMPNLIQMLSSSSERGTLTARAGTEEAVLAFEDGTIRYVRLGSRRGMKALSQMFSWEEGTFHFHAQVDALTDEDEPISLASAILEAVRQLDEAARPEFERYGPSFTFAVDLSEAQSAELSQLEQAVLELATPGLTLRRIIDVIPETDAEVLGAIQSLVDRGVVTPREG